MDDLWWYRGTRRNGKDYPTLRASVWDQQGILECLHHSACPIGARPDHQLGHAWIHCHDMGAALGATNPVEMGVKCPLYALLDEELENVPTGRYYGSDCKRSRWMSTVDRVILSTPVPTGSMR